MQLTYKGHKDNYTGIIEDRNINWLWSKKKNKYYAKIEDNRYMIIMFKNGYILVFDKGEKKKVDRLRNYYHIIKDGLVYEIIPKFEMPF